MNSKEMLRREAIQDAKAYAKAKMNYGEGAGIQRRLIEATLEKKMVDDTYREAFDDALDKVDYEKVIRDLKAKKSAEAFTNGVKRGTKKLVALAGVGVGLYSFYESHQEQCDKAAKSVKNFVDSKLNFKKKRKEAEDKEKARKFLESRGIKVD